MRAHRGSYAVSRSVGQLPDVALTHVPYSKQTRHAGLHLQIGKRVPGAVQFGNPVQQCRFRLESNRYKQATRRERPPHGLVMSLLPVALSAPLAESIELELYLYNASINPERSNSSMKRVSMKSFASAFFAGGTRLPSSAKIVLKPSSDG